MGEVLEGLGEMATPAGLGQALASIGLFVQAPTEADLAGELERLGSVELLRLELANWLLGAASMQVLMAQDAAIEGEVEAACITLASQRMLSGANCDDDHSKVMFAALLAKQLEHLLMVLVTDSLKGQAQMPMLIHPALPVAGHLAALLRAGADNLADTHTSSYAEQISVAAQGLTGVALVLEELAAKAKARAYEDSTDHGHGRR